MNRAYVFALRRCSFAVALGSMGVLASAQNLINNPHFSDGNAGFFSGYNYSSDLWPEGNYFVGSNPILYNSLAASFGDHTSGTGLMYIANGNLNPGAGIWIQSVNVTPNTTYTFTGWTASWGQAVGAPGIDPSPARLLISINGQVIPPFTLAPQDGVWTQFSMTWNSGNATTAILSLVDQNTDSVGNDFVLDDFEFAPVPEPASLVVVGIGVLAALRRRRRRI